MRQASSRTLFRYLAIGVLCTAFLLPVAFMIQGSLRQPGLPPPDGFEWLPASLEYSNYRAVFAFVPLWRQLANSLIVVAVAVPLTVLIASWAGFAIATSEDKARRRLIVVSVAALVVPTTALWVPRFAMLKWSGLTNTLLSLMTPALMATTPFYVLLFALAYARIPGHLFEAARLEGMSPLAIWRRVAFPLGKPAAFAVAVLAFVFHWSNFVDALLYLSAPDLYTVPLGLQALATLEPSLHPILLTGAVVATAPAALAFFIAQRAFFSKTLEV